MMKRFVLLYPEVENSSLVKDAGMIPFTLQKECGYEASIACYEKEHFSYLDNELKGLNIWKIQDKFHNALLDGLFFLKKNAREIDVLQLFHPIKRNVLWILCYLHNNPDGKVYLKLDADDRIITSVKGKSDPFHKIKKRMIGWLLTYPDYVTVETDNMSKKIEEFYGVRIPVMFNGFQDPDPEWTYREEQKEQILLTVARNGSYQKATDVLLQAYMEAEIPTGWKLRLVGSMEPEFEKKFLAYQSEFEKQGKQLEYVGEIADRSELFEEYQKADIFLLPSRFESFGIVLPEALSRGAYLITTDTVPSAEKLIPTATFGQIVKVDDVQELVHAIELGIASINTIHVEGQTKVDYAREFFTWEKIVKKLAIEIEKTPIMLVDYLGNCDENGEPVGHPLKVITESQKLLEAFRVYTVTTANMLKSIPTNRAIILKYAISPFQIGIRKIEKILGRYRNIRRIFRMSGRKKIWFCNTDFFLYVYLCFYHKKNQLCYATMYQNGYQNESHGAVKNYFYKRGRKKIVKEFVSYRNAERENCIFVPDYIYLPEKYDKYKKLEKEEKAVCLGTMNSGKELEQLVRVFNRLNYPLEITGFFQDVHEYEYLLKIKDMHISVNNCYLSEDEYLKKMACAKFSVLPYNMEQYKERTSGVVLESVFLNTIPIAPQSLLEQMHVSGIGYEKIDGLNEFWTDNELNESLQREYNSLVETVYQKAKVQERLRILDDEDWNTGK